MCFAIMIIALVSGVSVSGGSDIVSDLSQWGDTLALDERTLSEINRYAEDDGKVFSDGYALELAAGVRRMILAGVEKRIEQLLAGGCEPFVKVSYPGAGFARENEDSPKSKLERKFEDGFVLTELVAYFETDGVTPETALRLYTSPEFRKKASSRITRIWNEGEERCVEMSGVKLFLSPTLSCNRIDEFHRSDVAMQHSQVVRNGGDEGYQRVYFKESVKTFVVVPGGLALHYINYSRTVGMGGLQKSIGRKKIVGSQEDALDEFERILRRPTDPIEDQDE